jgi:hypothetical protein
MSSPAPGDLLNNLVDTHWDTAARHAWRQYQQRGRGAIVFPVEPDAGESKRTPLQYLTFTDEEAARKGSFDQLHGLVASYNPEQEIIAAAVLPDDRTVFDVYEQTPPPPQA